MKLLSFSFSLPILVLLCSLLLLCLSLGTFVSSAVPSSDVSVLSSAIS